MNISFSGFSEGFKDGRFKGLFNGISLVSEDVIVLGYLVGSSFGSNEGFKYHFYGKSYRFDENLG